MRGDPNDPASWLEFAKADLERARRMIADLDTAGGMFYLQQACEKFLKAKLIEKGWRLRRIHDLPELLNESRKLGIATPLRDETAALLAVEYIAGRYPSGIPDPEPTLDQAKLCYEEVSGMIQPNP
jgi:HEPN domain-containing protein